MSKKNTLYSCKGSPEEIRDCLERTARNRNSPLSVYVGEDMFSKYSEKQNPYLFLSLPTKWDDKMDLKNFSLDEDKISFVRCFSRTTDEDIGMWSLYGESGIKIEYSKTQINKILSYDKNKDLEIELIVSNGNPISMGTVADIKPDVKLFDVLYFKMCKDQKKVHIYINEADETNVSLELFEKIPAQMKKHTIWMHLAETRLVVSVDRKKIQEQIGKLSLKDNVIGLKISSDPKLIKSVHSSPIGNEKTGTVFSQNIQKSEYTKYVNIKPKSLSH